MKRVPLRRKTPLKRGGVDGGIGVPIARRTPLRSMSRKRSKQQRLRQQMVHDELSRRKLCEAAAVIRQGGYKTGCYSLSTELHEPLTRARGGSILDPANTVAICRICHDWIHEHPAAATKLGLLQSTNGGADRG